MIREDYINFTIEKQKRIALIAHDGMKDEMIQWVEEHKDILKIIFFLYRNYCKINNREN